MTDPFPRPEPARMEGVVHLCLGLAVLVAVIFSLGATFDFCAHLDSVAGSFCSDGGPPVVSGSGQVVKSASTNSARQSVPLAEPREAPETNPPAAVSGDRGRAAPMSG